MTEDFHNLKNDLQEYFEAKVDKARLELIETISRIVSNLLKLLIAGCLLFFILLSLSMSAGYYLADLFNSEGLGYLCIAIFYAIVLGIFFMLRRQILERPVIKMIIRLFYPSTDNEKNE